MRLAILSDIHGNNEALEKVVLDIEKNDIDGVVFLGDLVMKGPNPMEVYESLKKLKPICWLKGNTDLWLSDTRTENESSCRDLGEIELYRNFCLERITSNSIDFILNCPEKQSVNIGKINMLCVHGSPRSIVEVLSPSMNLEEVFEDLEEDIILCGHSHIPFLKKVGKKILFNPGSVGSPYDGNPSASYGVMEIKNDEVYFNIRRVIYPIDKLIKSAFALTFPSYEDYGYFIKKGIKYRKD